MLRNLTRRWLARPAVDLRPASVFPSTPAGQSQWLQYAPPFQPVVAERESELLHHFATLKLGAESNNWKRVSVESEQWDEEFLDIVTLPVAVPNDTEDVLYRDTLFVRKDYLGVFKALFRNRKSVVVGSPSVGKSWLQWVCLFFLANPEAFRVLCEGECQVNASPKVVIRFAETLPTFTVWFMEDRVVHQLPARHFAQVAKLFDQTDTVLLWKPDPAYETSVPAFEDLTQMQIWAAAFPFDRQTERFQRAGGVKVYLPCPSRDELFAMGQHLLDHPSTSRKAIHLNRQDLQDRFDKFGPFIHCVLPSSVEDLVRMETEHGRAVDHLSNEELLGLVAKDTLESEGQPVQLWLQRFALDPTNTDPSQTYFAPSVKLVVASNRLQDQLRAYAEVNMP